MKHKAIVEAALANVKETGKHYGDIKAAHKRTGQEIRSMRIIVRNSQRSGDNITVSLIARLTNLLVDEVKTLEKERVVAKAAYHNACNILFALEHPVVEE